MPSPQEDLDVQPLSVEVEPAVMITTTSHQEENHGDQPLGIRAASICKRKEPPILHSGIRKRLKTVVKKPAQLLDLNISKWWRRVERENVTRWGTIKQPTRSKKKMTMDWKLGYLPLWWMRMARESKVQSEEKSMKKSMATFLLQNNINKKCES